MTQCARRGGAPDSYALVSAAYNEEAYVGRTLESVASQTLQPIGWVIVSDGSTDRTDRIVASYAERLPFLQLLRVERQPGHSFASKIKALQVGFSRVKALCCGFLGNLDVDLSFEADYFEALLAKFRAQPRIGIGGGWIHEPAGTGFKPRAFNSPDEVPHGVQLIRRSCYEAIGDYVALPYGGEDTYAAALARMHGWDTRSFEDLIVRHHRPTGAAGGVVRRRFRSGLMDYSLGYHPLFELLKRLRRAGESPPILGTLLSLGGFAWGYLSREPRAVSAEVKAHLRRQQQSRMRMPAASSNRRHSQGNK